MNMSVRIRFLLPLLALVAVGGFTQETVHVMQRGETLYSIARSYGANIQDILSLNSISDPRKVQAGQRIKIPGAAGLPNGAKGTGYIDYQAVRGDSLFGIARKYGITLQELRAANKLRETYVLKAGDRLKIPRGAAALAAENPPASAGSTGTAPAAKGNATAGGAVQAQTVPAAAGSPAAWPVQVKELAYMTGKLYGVAILGERSESVKSLTQGTVISAGPYRGFGKVAIVQMTGGYLYVYGGCESLSVKEGDRVAPGAELGRLGLDGVTSKPHLFLMVYKNNAPIDPAKAPRA
jgi:murein DD-endopeptidase MepM/ murein hydrolase activator NlpD